MSYCVGYITAKDPVQAMTIGRALVDKRLAACANVFPIRSVYRWEEKVEQAEEAVLIIKTTDKMKAKIVSIVKALHTYSVPCVVFYDIKGGSADYLKWIGKNVG